MAHFYTQWRTMENITLLTPVEVASELKIDVRTVYKLLNSGELPSVRLGYRTKRIRRAALVEYVASREANT